MAVCRSAGTSSVGSVCVVVRCRLPVLYVPRATRAAIATHCEGWCTQRQQGLSNDKSHTRPPRVVCNSYYSL
eukprot:scaffold5726_cov72-Phaeocystis_antarctica.AAC.4